MMMFEKNADDGCLFIMMGTPNFTKKTCWWWWCLKMMGYINLLVMMVMMIMIS
jgi:hypothetical protein